MTTSVWYWLGGAATGRWVCAQATDLTAARIMARELEAAGRPAVVQETAFQPTITTMGAPAWWNFKTLARKG
jgi:hypothetical protein